jgi:hypothetical protein
MQDREVEPENSEGLRSDLATESAKAVEILGEITEGPQRFATHIVDDHYPRFVDEIELTCLN